jgi:hypothetical protein
MNKLRVVIFFVTVLVSLLYLFFGDKLILATYDYLCKHCDVYNYKNMFIVAERLQPFHIGLVIFIMIINLTASLVAKGRARILFYIIFTVYCVIILNAILFKGSVGIIS